MKYTKWMSGIAAALVAATGVMVGCQGSFQIKGHYAEVDPKTGQQKVSTYGEFRLGPAAPIPSDATQVCTVTINGHTTPVYQQPDGTQWTIDPDGDAHPVVGGTIQCGGQSGNQGVYHEPIGDPASHNLDGFDLTIGGTYDTTNDFAEVTLVWPVEYDYSYSPVSETPFAVTEQSQVLASGYRVIIYSGTINDVLGALWWLGIRQLELDDQNAGATTITWAMNANICEIVTDLGSETLVLEWTAPNNLP